MILMEYLAIPLSQTLWIVSIGQTASEIESREKGGSMVKSAKFLLVRQSSENCDIDTTRIELR